LGEGGRGVAEESQLRAHSKAKAIPPDNWNDVGFDDQCFLPIKIATGMLNDGLDVVTVAQKTSRRFQIPYLQMLRRVIRAAEHIAARKKHKNLYLMQEIVSYGQDSSGDERTGESLDRLDSENE